MSRFLTGICVMMVGLSTAPAVACPNVYFKDKVLFLNFGAELWGGDLNVLEGNFNASISSVSGVGSYLQTEVRPAEFFGGELNITSVHPTEDLSAHCAEFPGVVRSVVASYSYFRPQKGSEALLFFSATDRSLVTAARSGEGDWQFDCVDTGPDFDFQAATADYASDRPELQQLELAVGATSNLTGNSCFPNEETGAAGENGFDPTPFGDTSGPYSQEECQQLIKSVCYQASIWPTDGSVITMIDPVGNGIEDGSVGNFYHAQSKLISRGLRRNSINATLGKIIANLAGRLDSDLAVESESAEIRRVIKILKNAQRLRSAHRGRKALKRVRSILKSM